ncbi:hypothetical protein C8R45DRAFT_944399 [Mycena sanguinolenta]|nr:hypothetical protein C8R45DRAFT_944399 [Mycena sanguinolenta]
MPTNGNQPFTSSACITGELTSREQSLIPLRIIALRDQMQPVDAESTIESFLPQFPTFPKQEGVAYTSPEEGSVRHCSAAASALGVFLKVRDSGVLNRSILNYISHYSRGSNWLGERCLPESRRIDLDRLRRAAYSFCVLRKAARLFFVFDELNIIVTSKMCNQCPSNVHGMGISSVVEFTSSKRERRWPLMCITHSPLQPESPSLSLSPSPDSFPI